MGKREATERKTDGKNETTERGRDRSKKERQIKKIETTERDGWKKDRLQRERDRWKNRGDRERQTDTDKERQRQI